MSTSLARPAKKPAALLAPRDARTRQLPLPNPDPEPVTAKGLAEIRALVTQVATLDQQIVEIEATLAAKVKERDEILQDTMPSLFDEMGELEEVKLQDGTKVSLAKEYYPNVVKANEAKWFAWLRKNGFDSIIKNTVGVSFGKGEDAKAAKLVEALRKKGLEVAQKMTVHPQTLRAFVRERLEAGEALPPVVDVNEVRKAKIVTPK